jgi:hypothetical protein
VLCTEFLQAMGHHDDFQAQMSDAEVMTTAIFAMLYCGGNYAKARKQLGCPNYIPTMLSESRFSRRLNRLAHLFVPLFAVLAQTCFVLVSIFVCSFYISLNFLNLSTNIYIRMGSPWPLEALLSRKSRQSYCSNG